MPGVIDELPVLGALATHGGELRVSGAQELRVKESDRISALADGLRRMGGDIDEHAGWLPRARPQTGCAAAKWTPERPSPGDGVRDRGARRHRVRRSFTTRARPAVSYPSSFGARVAARVKTDKLYLVGFMGAGKSTRGPGTRARAWAGGSRTSTTASRRASGGGRDDLRAARRAIFPAASNGRCSASYSRSGSSIVATGGGTFVEPDNRALMLADGAVAWLDVPLERGD